MTGLFDLTGKAALVTGGNRGLGLGMAQALAQAGADLVIWGTHSEQLIEAGKTLAKYGKRVASRQVDVSKESEVIEGMEAAITLMGRLDCVIANAGISHMATGGEAKNFDQITLETWRNLLSINQEGAFLTMREAARHMMSRAKAGDPGGSLIGLSSVGAMRGAPRNEAYGASKAAVKSLMQSLAAEYGRYGIRANAIAPGWMETDMVGDVLSRPAFADYLRPRIPLQRWGKPADLGGLAVYLASDASAYHSGDCIIVDGGYSVS